MQFQFASAGAMTLICDMQVGTRLSLKKVKTYKQKRKNPDHVTDDSCITRYYFCFKGGGDFHGENK